MDLLTFSQAAALVDAYNQTNGNVTESAATIKRPREQCLAVLQWLWKFDFSRDPTGATSSTTARRLLPALTKTRWANYLYAHNVRPEVAAVLLRWTVHEVLHSCGGPAQWTKAKGRKCVMHVKQAEVVPAAELDDDDDDDDAPSDFPRPGEPTLDEIEARKQQVQSEWTPAQRAHAHVGSRRAHVEVFHWVDTRR